MNQYNEYVKAVNKIFEIVTKMKTSWKTQDNINYVDSIEEYKQSVIDNAKKFEAASGPAPQQLEELGND